MQCVRCSSDVVRYSIIFFLLLFLLLTVYCLVIIALRISGARPPMSTFILVSQVMASPQYMSLIFQSSIDSYHSQFVTGTLRYTYWKMFATFFGLWNLDLFRSTYPYMCFSQNMSTIQAIFIEYLIALYPLFILLIVYISITLYNRGYRFIFCLCRNIISCLTRFRQAMSVKTSLIDAFATFIILSINKVGYISYIMLRPSYVVSPAGNLSLYTYVDPTMPYFGWTHLPYALTALALIFLFIAIPVLLLLFYPLRSFQNFLNKCQWQCSTLHIFADTFHGCYKNGTNGTRDYRWFAGLHILLRFFVIFFFDLSNYYKINAVFLTLSISLYMALLSIFQPYKKLIYMKMDMLLLFGLLLWCTSLLLRAFYSTYGWFDFTIHTSLIVLSALVPTIHFVGVILYWLFVIKKIHVRLLGKLRNAFCQAERRLIALSE